MNNTYFKNKLRSIFKDNMARRVQKGTASGDLCFNRLWKAKLSTRVFQRPALLSEKAYNIGVLLDVSGSIHNNGLTTILKDTAERLVADLQDVTPLTIGTYNAVFEIIHKDTEPKWDTAKIQEMKEAIQVKVRDIEKHTYGKHSFGNHDGYALREFAKHFKGKKGDKIIFVVTDGFPSCDYPRLEKRACGFPGCFKDNKQLPEDLKKAILDVQAQGVKVIGIGLGTDSVKSFYKDYIVLTLENTGAFYDSLLGVLQKVVKRKA